jgi:hypothetical protein
MIDFAQLAQEAEQNTTKESIDVLRQRIMAGELPDEDAHVQLPGEIEASLPASFKECERQLIEALTFQAELDAKVSDLKQQLLTSMQENGIKKWESDSMVITRIFGTTRTTFDSKRFEMEHPDIYANYIKTSTTKDSIKLTIRKPK